jgi:hypothetical protein
MLAADSVTTTVFDTAGNVYRTYQQGTSVSVTSPYLDLGLTAEWFPERNVYLIGGIQASIALGNAVETQRRVLRPGNYDLGPGLGDRQTIEPSSISSINSLLLGLVGGIGATYPVSFDASVFAEATYTYMLSSLVSDARWGTSALRANIGLRYRG